MDTSQQNSGPSNGFRVTSTSLNSATVTPIILRKSDQVRLVFKAVLVNNDQEPSATVNGTFCYQRKRRADVWEDVQTVPLSTLKAGEGVKLDIHSGELLKLFKGLQILYETVARDGLPGGTHTYIQADRGTVLADVAELLSSGAAADVLKVFVEWAKTTQVTLASAFDSLDTQTLLNFDAAIGVAKLEKFLAEARANLGNDDESYWQALLKKQSWILSQLYASPMVILREQAYVGGKTIDNRGGSIVDYMFRNALSNNSLLVELKTPATALLTTTTYRNEVYGPSKELGGATQQLLHARQTLQEDYLNLTRRDPGKFNIFGTRSLLVIGTMPSVEDEAKLRSFEIYRNAHRGLEIVTFDELITKGGLLLEALSA